MCIFSQETIAKKTIIAAGVGHFSYQNKIVAEKDTVMIVPVPGWDLKFWQAEAGSLESLLSLYEAKYPPKSYRGGLKSIEIEQVGQYTIYYTPYGEVASTLTELEQPIYPWLGEMLSRYKGWNFLLVKMSAGDNMANQPFFVTYTPFWDNIVYAPMMDVHGDEPIRPSAERNHAVFIQGDAGKNTIEYNGPIEEWKGTWTGFKFGYDSNGHWMENGDAVVKNGDAVIWNTKEKLEEAWSE